MNSSKAKSVIWYKPPLLVVLSHCSLESSSLHISFTNPCKHSLFSYSKLFLSRSFHITKPAVYHTAFCSTWVKLRHSVSLHLVIGNDLLSSFFTIFQEKAAKKRSHGMVTSNKCVFSIYDQREKSFAI